MSILIGQSQLLRLAAMPRQWFFLAIFLTAEPCRVASLDRLAQWSSLASCPTHNAQVDRSPRSPPVAARPQSNMQTDFRISIKFL